MSQPLATHAGNEQHDAWRGILSLLRDAADNSEAGEQARRWLAAVGEDLTRLADGSAAVCSAAANAPRSQDLMPLQLSRLSRQAGVHLAVLFASPLVAADARTHQRIPLEPIDYRTECELLLAVARESHRALRVAVRPATVATLSALLTEGCDVLHFSGHGFVDSAGMDRLVIEGARATTPSWPLGSGRLAHRSAGRRRRGGGTLAVVLRAAITAAIARGAGGRQPSPPPPRRFSCLLPLSAAGRGVHRVRRGARGVHAARRQGHGPRQCHLRTLLLQGTAGRAGRGGRLCVCARARDGGAAAAGRGGGQVRAAAAARAGVGWAAGRGGLRPGRRQ